MPVSYSTPPNKLHPSPALKDCKIILEIKGWILGMGLCPLPSPGKESSRFLHVFVIMVCVPSFIGTSFNFAPLLDHYFNRLCNWCWNRTALHWACKRGHPTVVECLLQNGAESSIQNDKGETCLQLTENPQVRILLGGKYGITSFITGLIFLC